MFGIIPLNAQITIERDASGNAKRYCVDAETEQILQNQRMFAMLGSGVLLASSYYLKGPKVLRYAIGGMGVACFFAHFTARQAILKAEKQS
jgi:Zn/Cd-binding protein ZinT